MLSVIIITKNESSCIERCINSIQWADEIIVLDSGSSDDTVARCRALGAIVFETDWPGFGPQKQRALSYASHEWVLSLDADEIVTEGLKKELLAVLHHGNADGYAIPRLSTYCGQTIRHCGWWPDYVTRLFKREKGRFTDDIVHEQILVGGSLSKLTNPLHHEAFVDHEEVISKINLYSTLGAQKLYDKGKTSTPLLAVSKGTWTFFKTFILNQGFLDGKAGLMLSISNSLGTYYKYLKLFHLSKSHH